MCTSVERGKKERGLGGGGGGGRGLFSPPGYALFRPAPLGSLFAG